MVTASLVCERCGVAVDSTSQWIFGSDAAVLCNVCRMKQYAASRAMEIFAAPAPTAPTARRYRVTVWASVPLEEGENEDGTPDGVLYPQYTAKELEKHLIKLLRKAEPECDLEVMDYEDVEA